MVSFLSYLQHLFFFFQLRIFQDALLAMLSHSTGYHYYAVPLAVPPIFS